WTPQRMAAAFDALMQRLGYAHYGTHGGDWGSLIATEQARAFSGRVFGIHLSMLVPVRPRTGDPLAGLTADERAALDRMYADVRSESGYQHVQSTRPQSLAAGLKDSPGG